MTWLPLMLCGRVQPPVGMLPGVDVFCMTTHAVSVAMLHLYRVQFYDLDNAQLPTKRIFHRILSAVLPTLVHTAVDVLCAVSFWGGPVAPARLKKEHLLMLPELRLTRQHQTSMNHACQQQSTCLHSSLG